MKTNETEWKKNEIYLNNNNNDDNGDRAEQSKKKNYIKYMLFGSS